MNNKRLNGATSLLHRTLQNDEKLERQLRLRQEKLDLMAIIDFIPKQQARYLVECFRSRDYENEHAPELRQLAEAIKALPVSYEQEGKGNEAIVFLHYFTSSADWWITEKDTGSIDDGPEDSQTQAFGLASMNGCDPEWGYISIRELCSTGSVELDFHFKPRTVREIKE